MLLKPREIDKLTIVGLGASVYDFVNHTWLNFEETGEVWTINSGAMIFRHDMLWDMHTPEFLELKHKAKGKSMEPALRRREWLNIVDLSVADGDRGNRELLLLERLGLSHGLCAAVQAEAAADVGL